MSYISSNKDYLWAAVGAIAIQNGYLLTSTTVVLICAIAAYWLLIVPEKSTDKNYGTDFKNRDGGYSQIPMAPSAIPVLGHALSYRRDPPGFLIRMRRQCGPIFQLNLAGKIMILVCGPKEQLQLANVPESVLSLREAVGAIGFEQTLGYKNVHKGTNIHKGIVKAILNSTEGSNGTSLADRQLIAWQASIQEAMNKELIICDGNNSKVDFFHLIRRVMLRAVVEMFIGKVFLRDWTSYDFLKEFMDFQDTLEDVTAKVVILPRWLALVAMLWPLQRRRERMQLVIQERLENVLQKKGKLSNDTDNDDPDVGFWLRDILRKKHPISDIAEYIVGLLFAGHKNPAIGAAQSYLLLQEYGSAEVRAQCQKEAALLISTTIPIKWSQFKSSLPTLHRACLESLRLTAHSIGGVRTAQKDLTVLVNAGTDTNDGMKETIYRITKGASVAFSHITSSLDTSIWGENAGVFDSDLRRYSEESYTDDYKFSTFSHGVHKCPGREMAMIHLKITVALLLTEYEIKLPEKIPPLDFERATLAQREGAVMVSITQRHRQQK